MDAYALVAPFLLIGGVAFFLPIVTAWVVPRYKRPFLTAWAVSSFFLGSALCIDEITMQGSSLIQGLALALLVAGGLAVLTPLLWWRIHMWDLVAARERRHAGDERNSQYRPVDFSE